MTPVPATMSTAQVVARLTMATALLILGTWTISGFLPALAWACIIAVGTWPLYSRAVRAFPPTGHGVLLPLTFTLLVALLFLVPLGAAALQIGREAGSLASLARDARSSGVPVPGWLPGIPLIGGQVTAWWTDNLTDPRSMAEGFRHLVSSDVLSYGRSLGAQVSRRVTSFGFTLLALFFLYKDGLAVCIQLRRASHRTFGPSGERVGRQVLASIRGTMDGLVLVGLAEGAVMGVAYLLAGAPHPALLGAATAIGSMLPLGAPLVFVVACGLLTAKGSVVAGISVLAFGVIMVGIVDHTVRPAMIGGSTRLPFLWVLFGILGGIETWGLLGLFVGPALMAALILLWREWASVPLPGTQGTGQPEHLLQDILT